MRRATILASCATVLLALGSGRATEPEAVRGKTKMTAEQYLIRGFDAARGTAVSVDGLPEGAYSPRLEDTDLYLDLGEGFHSNDARIAVLRTDQDFDPLTPAVGYEVGARTRRWDRLEVAVAVWLIDLDDEAGLLGESDDVAGAFESAGPSRRWGVDFETRYQLTRWLTADYDLAYAAPDFRSRDAIPLAPTLLMTGGLTVEPLPGLSLALRARYVDDGPANRDGSFVGSRYFLLDLAGEYRWRNVEASIQLLNLTNANRPEAPVASRDEIRFTSRSPFGVIAGLNIHF